MTRVIIEDAYERNTTFEELAIGEAYYSLNDPETACIKVTHELCIYYSKNVGEWNAIDERPSEPVCRIDAEIKFMY